MENILFTWIGATDLGAVHEPQTSGAGPIGQAGKEFDWDTIVLLCSYSEEDGESYRSWLRKVCTVKKVNLHCVSLSSPTDYADIYHSAVTVLKQTKADCSGQLSSTFHLSPGTPAMAAVWIILSKTSFHANLIESSRDHGVKKVVIPFDIAADYVPSHVHVSDSRIVQLAAGLSEKSPAFADIVHRSEVMQRVIVKARRVADRSVPVLIEGESGTGKELFARAIHAESPRAPNPFVVINCGAIPEELMESELFGHKKGAFTGASDNKKGFFEMADSGTLFLDEIGELPLSMQVKLLRVLQEGEVRPVGATKQIKVDVRIIAATNRNLLLETTRGNFRKDLFYRLAVAILQLPPLRERDGDIGLLISAFMKTINKECKSSDTEKDKKISVSARNLLQNHPWPGNVREMLNTMIRAYIWTPGAVIEEEDIREALFVLDTENSGDDAILGRPVSRGVDLPGIMQRVASHYLREAMKTSHGNKAMAAKLLNLPSYQTLTNWIKKYGAE